jgi:hypothetical protein
MAQTNIPEKDAMLLLRAMGLLMSQAGVYGPAHNVTQGTARSVFAELEQSINAFGPVEIALRDQQIVINGCPGDVNDAKGKNLADRMALHRISGLLFLAPPDSGEFLKFITLFGTSPAGLAAEGGFESAVKNALLRSVKVVSVSYQRMSGEKPPDKPPEPQSPPAIVRRPAAALASNVLDLSAAFSDVEKASEAGPGEELAHQEKSSKLASLLRELAAQLESGKGGSAQALHPDMADALSRARSILSDMATGSERDIEALSEQVKEDRQTIDSIEAAARRRGVALQLTRGELLQRYAELNQEIAQPLTVSTGVIDMLSSGSAGAVTESQRELLKLAAESVGRVNQLVAYMNRISGLPDSFTPDRAVIADSYR